MRRSFVGVAALRAQGNSWRVAWVAAPPATAAAKVLPGFTSAALLELRVMLGAHRPRARSAVIFGIAVCADVSYAVLCYAGVAAPQRHARCRSVHGALCCAFCMWARKLARPADGRMASADREARHDTCGERTTLHGVHRMMPARTSAANAVRKGRVVAQGAAPCGMPKCKGAAWLVEQCFACPFCRAAATPHGVAGRPSSTSRSFRPESLCWADALRELGLRRSAVPSCGVAHCTLAPLGRNRTGRAQDGWPRH